MVTDAAQHARAYTPMIKPLLVIPQNACQRAIRTCWHPM
jgi:hypothetical protein